jgi:capsular exopolysaccharide synthesis family protein
MSRTGAESSGSEILAPPVIAAGSRNLPALPGVAATTPTSDSSGPEILHDGFNQTWLVNGLRRRWMLALLMGLLVGGLLGGVMLWAFPETSRITALLEVKNNSNDPLADNKSQGVNPILAEREAMSHLALLKSPLVLDAALQRPEIAQLDAVQAYGPDAILWLTDELKVSFPGDGEILEVRYEGDEDSGEMIKLIDAIVRAYKDKVLLQDRLLRVGTRDDLEQVLQAKKAQLKTVLEEFKERSNSIGAMQEEVEIPTLRTEITFLQNKIEEVKKELVDIEVMKQLAVQSARSPAALEQQLQLELEKDPAIANYKQSLFTLDQEIQMRSALGKQRESAVLKQLIARRDQTQAMMEQTRAVAQKEIRDRLAKIPNEGLRQTIIEHKIRFDSAQASLKDFEEKLKTAQDKLAKLGVRDPQLEMLENDITSQQLIVADLEQRIGEFRIAQQASDLKLAQGQDSDFEKVRVVQNATAQDGVNTVERILLATVGGLTGLALTCYCVALVEFRHRRLNGPGEVDEGLGVRVLAVMPAASPKALVSRGLIATQAAESIDNVRSALLQDSKSRRHQVLLVTSPESMEGATTVAVSLAMSLARAGRRTLIVDGDLRSPTLHKFFGLPLEDGLSEVLRTQTELSDAIRHTPHDGLHFLSAGVCDFEAVRLLATEQPQAIIEKLRDQFDFVVIDCPPILSVSDSSSIGQFADGAILAVLRDQSSIPNIHQAVEKLRLLGVKLLGAVVGGVAMKPDRRVLRLHQASLQRQAQLPAAQPVAAEA